jgi:hypothetical protein
LPEGTPAACGDGRTFVGWCKTSDYEDETTAPEFVQNGDAATSSDIFYAVFANVAEGSAVNSTYTFTSKSWADATNSWNSI